MPNLLNRETAVYIIVSYFYFISHADKQSIDFIVNQATSLGESVIQHDYDKTKKCRITLAEKTFWRRQQCIAYPKNSPLTKPIDRQ